MKRLQPWLRDETFMLTYGDGVCDVDLDALLAFHRAPGTPRDGHRGPSAGAFRRHRASTATCVAEFTEKPQIGEGWINGGFMVFEPDVSSTTSRATQRVLELDALERLAAERQLAAYRHDRFWQCMDTLRDKRVLEAVLGRRRRAPWKVWR